jgi:uncharacterized protein (DUF488 family)
MLKRLLTIGAFGFDEKSFFNAIAASGADLFCDIRLRRGVRGSEYAFVNSARLQVGLAKRDIRYIHIVDLAPTKDMLDAQHAIDKKSGIPSRQRAALSPEYLRAYRTQRLSKLNSRRFATQFLSGAARPIFFCVEREPKACHRSLVVAKLSKDLGLPIKHLKP